LKWLSYLFWVDPIRRCQFLFWIIIRSNVWNIFLI
jgi:hypothetical protein